MQVDRQVGDEGLIDLVAAMVTMNNDDEIVTFKATTIDDTTHTTVQTLLHVDRVAVRLDSDTVPEGQSGAGAFFRANKGIVMSVRDVMTAVNEHAQVRHYSPNCRGTNVSDDYNNIIALN